jgi:RHS repeat-associated protein
MAKLKIWFLIFVFLFSPLAVFAQAETTPPPTDTQSCVIPVYLFATQEGGSLAITPVAENQYLYAYATFAEKVETGLINPTGTATADRTSTELGNQAVIPMGLLLVAVGSDPDAVNSFLETGEGVGQRIFTGHIADDSTTLQYFGARYYQGDVGRFWSEDPLFLTVGNNKDFNKIIKGDNNKDIEQWLESLNLGNKISSKDYLAEKYSRDFKEYLGKVQQLNSYSYVGNNPLKYKDAQGEVAVLAIPAVIGGEALITAAEVGLVALGATAMGIIASKMPDIKWTPNQTLPNIHNNTRSDEMNLFPNGLPPNLPNWGKAAILIGTGAVTIGYALYEKYQDIKGSVNNTQSINNSNQPKSENLWSSNSKRELLKSNK